MYIVEWYDHEGNRHELAFNNLGDAYSKMAELEEDFDRVTILWETEV